MNKNDSSLSKPGPDFSRERALHARGLNRIAGVDEVGRGPLAGPVVVATVVLNPDHIPDGLNDSKKLTKKRRDALYRQIVLEHQICVTTAPPEFIDRVNIRAATLWAMRQAVLGLPVLPDHVLVDGRDIPPDLPCPADFVIGGDGKSLSIAAASIVAKVTRDRMCALMDVDCPGYSFAAHKGYGTAMHMAELSGLGVTPHHRKSFAPVRNALGND